MKGLLLTAIVLLALAAVPWVGLSYHVEFLLILLMYLVLATSYDLVGGHMGYLNLGHSVFYGLGAYTFGLLYRAGGGLFLALMGAGGVACFFALLIGIPFFRMRGAYFALGTLGLIFLMELLALNLRGLTQGAHGLDIAPGPRLNPAYHLTLGLAALTWATVYLLARSRFGLALRSIREDEDAASAYGIDVLWYKVVALMVSALFAGLMGGVFMWHHAYVNPEEAFGLQIAFVPIVMAMVGGTGHVAGPLVGVVMMTLIQELLWTRLGYLQVAFYGAVLVGVGLLMPGGLVRFLRVDRLIRSDYRPRYARLT